MRDNKCESVIKLKRPIIIYNSLSFAGFWGGLDTASLNPALMRVIRRNSTTRAFTCALEMFYFLSVVSDVAHSAAHLYIVALLTIPASAPK